MALNLILGVDAGCNGVKVVGPKGALDFPSITIVEPPAMMKFGNALGIKNKFELTVENEAYILGEHAEFLEQFNAIGGIDRLAAGTKNDESAFIRAFGGICQYIDNYEKFDDEDVNIYFAYGSPIVNATSDKEVSDIENYFKNDGKPHNLIYNGQNLNIYIKDIIVLPEGAAAFFSTDFDFERVYVVDAGSQTINLAALVNGIPVPTGADTIPNGVEYYKKMYPNRAADMLAKKIKSSVESLRWPEGSTLHVCGGFALELATAFNDLKNNVYTMELMKPELPMSRKSKPLEPIFANAAGLYFIAKEAFSTTVKG